MLGCEGAAGASAAAGAGASYHAGLWLQMGGRGLEEKDPKRIYFKYKTDQVLFVRSEKKVVKCIMEHKIQKKIGFKISCIPYSPLLSIRKKLLGAYKVIHL